MPSKVSADLGYRVRNDGARARSLPSLTTLCRSYGVLAHFVSSREADTAEVVEGLLRLGAKEVQTALEDGKHGYHGRKVRKAHTVGLGCRGPGLREGRGLGGTGALELLGPTPLLPTRWCTPTHGNVSLYGRGVSCLPVPRWRCGCGALELPTPAADE